jgi:hypothetical protein
VRRLAGPVHHGGPGRRASFAIVASGLQQCLTSGDELDSVDVKNMEKLFLSLAWRNR